MTKIAYASPATGAGTVTLRAPVTETNVDLELPLTGTHLASAQADGMPLGPGGDPVVESGSNSDGEWVRWADGTQQCISATPFSNDGASGVGSSTIVTLPTTFMGNFYVNWSADNATASNAFANANGSDNEVRVLGYNVSSGFAASSSSATFTGRFFAHGRWK